MKTLKSLINKKSNDYSTEEKRFNVSTGLNLLSTNDQFDKKVSLSLTETLSIIVSCYMGHETLPILLKSLKNQTYKNFEVVIIDDGSPKAMIDLVSNLRTNLKIKFIREEKNMGRSYTRNTGMLFSDGKSLIFTDQDIIFDKNFVFNFAIRQQYTQNCAFLGFKEDIEKENVDKRGKAKLTSDWRYEVMGNEDFISLSINKNKIENPNRKFQLLEETNNFKSFGFGKSFGFWDLSSAIISHSLCVKKSKALESGGFPEKDFEGWGAQDIAFGARLIGVGCYIVPVINNISFHINHQRYSGSREIELKELRKNIESYFKMVNSSKWKVKPETRKLALVKKIDNKTLYTIRY